MWGTHVDSELKRAAAGAANEEQAQAKVQMRYESLMRDEEEMAAEVDEHKDFPKHLRRQTAPTKFRDPMDVMKNKKG